MILRGRQPEKQRQKEPLGTDTLLGMRQFRYLDALTTAFVVILLVSNLVAQKVCAFGPFFGIGPLYLSGAVLLFPITYIFGDVFTEVFGFSASRRSICTRRNSTSRRPRSKCCSPFTGPSCPRFQSASDSLGRQHAPDPGKKRRRSSKS